MLIIILPVFSCVFLQVSHGADCPDVFRKLPRSKDDWNRIAAILTLKPKYDVTGVFLQILFENKVQLLTNEIGPANTLDNQEYFIESPDLSIRKDDNLETKITVNYDATEAEPTFSVIRFNGELLCPSA